ncbi:MAG: DNA-binding SARP family transcriptional activator [Candidatus Promineifilaceae bacterium]|jgi:DNA-binding SARP family transcriptional activator
MTLTNQFDLLLLGQFTICYGQEKRPFPPLRRKTRALLAYLIAVDAPCSRQALMDMFCQCTNSPARTLTLLLSRIHKQVDVLHITNSSIQFKPSSAQVDVAFFQQTLAGTLDEQRTDAIQTAISLYRGEFLEGLTLPNAPEFELWLLNQRARTRHLLERGLGELVRQEIENGRFQAAIPHAQQLIHSDPLLEDAHAQLIWLYAQTGQREAALQQYAHCHALLQDELGVNPTDTLQKLHADVLSRELKRPLSPTLPTLPVVPPAAADFVGRTTEYAHLQTAWYAAQTGQGMTMMIGAVAGGGKSRLISEMMRSLPETAVYVGHCYESTRALPYQPWLLILETHLQRLDDAALRQIPSTTQAYISRLLPAMARRLPQTAVSVGSIDEPARLFTAIVDFLSQHPSGSPAPCLFFIDDLQWGDEASLRLLQYVSQRIARFSWLLIGAYRTEEAADAPALTVLLDELAHRDSPHLTLSPLTTTEIEALSVHMWPQSAVGYRGHIASMVAQATGGNALFVTAVLQELATANHIPVTLPVPATVQELIQRRLRRLPQGGQQLLEALAVVGDGATRAQLQQISARGDEETAQALEWGERWGLTQSSVETFPATYHFHHDLVRKAIYAALSAMRKQRLHYRAATWFARIAHRQPEAIQQEQAGRILYHAQPGEAFALLFHWSPIAAAHARSLFAYQDAMHMLDAMRNAYDQLHFLPGFDPAVAEPLLFDQLIWWLRYSRNAGKSIADQRSALQQAQTILTRHPTPMRTALFQFVHAELALDNEEEIVVKQDVHRQFLQLGKPSMAAAALASAARRLITLSRNKNGRLLYEQALTHYQQAGDISGEVSCLAGLAWTAINLGEISVALHHSQHALTISQAQGDKLGEAQALFSLTASWGFYAIPDKIMTLATAAMRLYKQVGFQGQAVRPYLYVGSAHTLYGEWEEALAVYEDVLAQATAFQGTWAAGWSAQLAGRIYLRWGQLAAAAEKLQQARQIRIETGERQNQVSDLAWLGRLALAQGDTEGALAHTEQSIAQLDAFHGEFYVWEQPDVLLCRVEALEAAGERAAAHKMAQRAQSVLHQFAEQIDDTAVLRQFMEYELYVGVKTAVYPQPTIYKIM